MRDGLVDVDASIKRIEETSGSMPCHAAQREQLKKYRKRKLLDLADEQRARDGRVAARHAWVESGGYRSWLERSRESRAESKRRARRAAGAITRAAISENARVRADEREQLAASRRAERERQRLEFIGPQKPKSGTAAHFRIRYQTDESFREKEKARVAAKKARVPLSYARQQLRMGKDAPDDLVQLKRMHMLIKKSLRRIEDEKH
jgi:hypothetical protein